MIASRTTELPEGLQTVDEALHRTRFRILPFLGPAFIACVAYIDPGNFATNIAGGSKFGYTLVWVIVASNLMAMLIQTLSAKLGIATGRNLPEVCREQLPRRVSFGLWLQAEAIAMATDLAEFLGAAVGFHLLFGFGLFPSAVLTGIAAFGILGLQRYGVRLLEAVIAAIVGVIGACYLGELIFSNPDLGQVGRHALVPGFSGSESVLLAVGILGATVMPHVIYLHSALTSRRIDCRDDGERSRVLRFERLDVIVALGLAGLVNMAMLAIAAKLFHTPALAGLHAIGEGHAELGHLVGGGAALAFAVALLASGASSSSVGTYAGQVVMAGFIRVRVSLWLRRAVTMLPALALLAAGTNPTDALVLSQVVLAFGIPFALVPLVAITSDRDVMGVHVNSRVTTLVAVAVAGLVTLLNVFLLGQQLLG
ncbi:MAG TPA: Nramp family divalent metal transporter [Solirubrobacteraceae bacterium]|nr:Nramp family divalent metal transporter [Solirubrobacteraceae bacterium]